MIVQKQDIVSRAERCQTVACERLRISEDELMMLLFDSGCELIERFCKRLPAPSIFPPSEFTASNEYWYWWTKQFILIVEIWLTRRESSLDSLKGVLRLARGPLPGPLKIIEAEIILKK